MLIESWRRHYNTIRPHSSLGYRPPAPETASPPLPPSGSATRSRAFKGRYIEVSGSLRENRWTDKEDKERFEVQLMAERISFLERKPADAA